MLNNHEMLQLSDIFMFIFQPLTVQKTSNGQFLASALNLKKMSWRCWKMTICIITFVIIKMHRFAFTNISLFIDCNMFSDVDVFNVLFVGRKAETFLRFQHLRQTWRKTLDKTLTDCCYVFENNRQSILQHLLISTASAANAFSFSIVLFAVRVSRWN